MNEPSEERPRISYLEIARAFVRRKRAITRILVCSTLTGLALAFLLPKWYFTYGSVKSSSSQRAGLSSLFGSMGGIEQLVGGFGDLGGSLGNSDLQTFAKILDSRRVLLDVIRKFNLFEEYNEKYQEDAIAELRSNLKIKPDIESSILTIGVFDKDSNRVEEIASYLIELLNNVNIELSTSRAGSTRQFVEGRYLENAKDLRAAEDSLKHFQKKYGVYLLEEQAKSAIEAVATLQAQRTVKEIQAGILEKQFTSDQPDVKRLKYELEEIDKRINDFYFGTKVNGVEAKESRLFVPFADAPEVGQKYLRLYRDVKIQERISEILLPLYEKAKIEEKQDTPTLMIIDKPFVPEKKSKPYRALVVLVAFSLGALLSMLYVLIVERYEYVKAYDLESHRKMLSAASEMSKELRWFLPWKKN